MPKRKRSKRKGRPRIFYRISYVVNASGSIEGIKKYCTVEGYFFAFSEKQKWIDKLHEVVDAVARARGIDPDAGFGGEAIEEGKPIEAVPKDSEEWLSIMVGEETQPVKKADLPNYPFYVASIRVNDREIGKVDLVERDLSRFPIGLRSYLASLLVVIVDEVVKWSRNLL